MSDTEAQADAPEEQAPEATGSEPKAPTPKTDKESKSQPKAESKSDSEPKAKDESGPAPWAKDLSDRGLDDPRIDEYLRDVWQPRMTQFEQQVAEWSDMFGGDMEKAAIMAGLAEALEADPEGTYSQMGELLGIVAGEPAPDAPDSEALADGEMPDEDGGEPDEYRQWVMDKMAQEQEAQQDEAYEALLGELEEAHPGFDRELFHAAIVAFEGDPEMALEWYMKYHRAPEPEASPDGPAPLGEGDVTPPEQAEYSNIGDAIADFMSQDKTAKSR